MRYTLKKGAVNEDRPVRVPRKAGVGVKSGLVSDRCILPIKQLSCNSKISTFILLFYRNAEISGQFKRQCEAEVCRNGMFAKRS